MEHPFLCRSVIRVIREIRGKNSWFRIQRLSSFTHDFYVAWKDYRDYLRSLPDHGALPADEIRR